MRRRGAPIGIRHGLIPVNIQYATQVLDGDNYRNMINVVVATRPSLSIGRMR
jgi:hypothetical protein